MRPPPVRAVFLFRAYNDAPQTSEGEDLRSVNGSAVRVPGGPHLRVVPQPAAVDLSEIPRTVQGKETAIDELDSLIGLASVKCLIFEIYAYSEIQKKRERAGLLNEKTVLHMVFKGNPGTGKTTIARIIGRLLFEAGLLQKGHMVEVERADLVGEYIGHTAQRTREQIRKAQGGILFVDEAYSLCRGGDKDFGKECVDCIVKGMEDNAGDTVFILAGYPVEMEQFLRSNPGLRSRFPIHLDFPNYTVEDLLKIADLMLRKRDYRLAADGYAVLESIIRERMALEVIPSNARLVRNLIEKAMRRQAVRLVRDKSFTRQDLMFITARELLEAAADVV
jgi:stage V sporulation protein K